MQHACIMTWKAAEVVLKPVMTRTVDDKQLPAWVKKNKVARDKFCKFARALHECSKLFSEDSRCISFMKVFLRVPGSSQACMHIVACNAGVVVCT